MRYCLLLGLLTLAGCGPSAPPPPDDSPLTVEQWKALPVSSKYTIETYERLRRADPALDDPKAWHKFARDVITPARKRDGVPAPTHPQSKGSR